MNGLKYDSKKRISNQKLMQVSYTLDNINRENESQMYSKIEDISAHQSWKICTSLRAI